MKIKNLLLLMSLVTGISLIQPIQAESTVQAQNNSQSVVFDMQNMTGLGSKITIRRALILVDGVQKVDVNYYDKIAAVTFDPQKTNIDALIKITTDAGFPATIRQSNR